MKKLVAVGLIATISACTAPAKIRRPLTAVKCYLPSNDLTVLTVKPIDRCDTSGIPRTMPIGAIITALQARYGYDFAVGNIYNAPNDATVDFRKFKESLQPNVGDLMITTGARMTEVHIAIIDFNIQYCFEWSQKSPNTILMHGDARRTESYDLE